MSFPKASPSRPSEQLELEQTIHFHPSSVIERTFKENPEAEDSSEGYSFNLFINKLLIHPSEPPQPSNGPDPWDDWDEDEEEGEIKTILSVVPSIYHDFLEVFSKAKASKLPERHPCDHSIELVGPLPPVGPIYSLSNKVSEVLQMYITDNLSKGFIRSSTSSTGAGILFAPSEDGGLQLCVDYWKLNSVTRKNHYPVPPMGHLLTLFNGATIFTKIDLCNAYYLICIKEGQEHLTCFRTRFGSFEYLVMPFGLTNAPASFQALVNEVFSDLLDSFVAIYLDDIMIYTKKGSDHEEAVRTVLDTLSKHTLWLKPEKCEFSRNEVEYLGLLISCNRLRMDPTKVKAVTDWPPPRNVTELQ